MTEQHKHRRCPGCREQGTLVVHFEYWEPSSGERELMGMHIRCTRCTFSKVLVGFPVRSAVS